MRCSAPGHRAPGRAKLSPPWCVVQQGRPQQCDIQGSPTLLSVPWGLSSAAGDEAGPRHLHGAESLRGDTEKETARLGRRGTQERRAAGLTLGWAFLEFLEHPWVVGGKEESEGLDEESLCSDSDQLRLFSEAKTKAGVSFTN